MNGSIDRQTNHTAIDLPSYPACDRLLHEVSNLDQHDSQASAQACSTSGSPGYDTAGTFMGRFQRLLASQQWLTQTPSAILAEVSYCLASSGTILFNKHLLATWLYPAPNALLCFQFMMAVVLLQVLHSCRVVHLAPLQLELVLLWMPLVLIFVGMNVTGFYALQTVGAGMFTVLKNLSNVLTIIGDYYFFGNVYSLQVWACLGLILASAVLGGFSDLHFSASGYAWQAANCAFTAGYSLMLGGVIRRATASPSPLVPVPQRTDAAGGNADSPSAGERPDPTAAATSTAAAAAAAGAKSAKPPSPPLSELSMVYYNNALSVPPLLLLVLCSNEWHSIRRYPQYFETEFQVVALVGALLGFGVSFASIWCMKHTSPTLFSMTGSLNKVIVAIVGLTYFAEPTNPLNLASIVVGILAGVLFVFAKSRKVGLGHTSDGDIADAAELERLLVAKVKRAASGSEKRPPVLSEAITGKAARLPASASATELRSQLSFPQTT